MLAARSPSPASQPTPQPVFVSPLLISPVLGPGTPRRSARGGQSRCTELLMEGHGTGTRRRPATCLSKNGHPRHADGTRMWCTSSPLHANLGVTGPRDPVSGRGDMPSMPMIHRTHLDIFDGKSLPDSFLSCSGGGSNLKNIAFTKVKLVFFKSNRFVPGGPPSSTIISFWLKIDPKIHQESTRKRTQKTIGI